MKYLNFFSRLPDYLVTRMLPSCELRVFLKDSFIWQKGTYCEAFYIMLKGSANIEKFYASINSTITINSIYDGEMFGD